MDANVAARSAEGLLILLGLEGVGAHVAWKLGERFRTIGEIRKAAEETIRLATGRVLPALHDPGQWERAGTRARSIVQTAYREGVRLLTLADDAYPVWLREIPDRPPVIFVRGDLPPGRRYVACVGTRRPTAFGVGAARSVAGFLAESGWSVVSGLAVGVDTEAHRAALECGGHTVAVLGNGLDEISPRTNAGLAEEILASGGALISEQPFGVRANGWRLVQRNRLQSGMSAGTVVVESSARGGSMHTARFCLFQGRLLFAIVPGEGGPGRSPAGAGLLTRPVTEEICDRLRVDGQFRNLLLERFGAQPPAIPLSATGNDREKFLARLERAAGVAGVAGARSRDDAPERNGDEPAAPRQPRLPLEVRGDGSVEGEK